MKKKGTTCRNIVVADRNPHIRTFLKRELAASGLTVQLVENAKELLHALYSRMPISLLVLDPDLPGLEGIDLDRKLINRIPNLPVVLHEIKGSNHLLDLSQEDVVRIEKNGSSIEDLKHSICQLLHETQPRLD